MAQYKAPLRDMQFILHDMLNVENHYASIPAFADTNRELVDSVLEAAAQFCENELSPINRSGDEEGCQFDDGVVTTPQGFKEAYKKYVELGFGSLSAPVEHGGQGLPPSLGTVMSELMGTANWSWGMYPGLSHGAINTIEAHGTPRAKRSLLNQVNIG
jgi:alkylation response protein AidB-like acyl-CoA dehydrogenase